MNNFLAALTVRVTLAYFLLFYSDIPFLAKLILIHHLDGFDSDGPNKISSSLDKDYDIYDKVADILSYGLILIKYLQITKDNRQLKAYISFLFLWRAIGIVMFLKTNDKMMFVYFPNAFFESIVLLSVAESINFKDNNLMIFLLSLVFIAKVIFEYYFHIKKGTFKNISSLM
jgi:hypothetical protein